MKKITISILLLVLTLIVGCGQRENKTALQDIESTPQANPTEEFVEPKAGPEFTCRDLLPETEFQRITKLDINKYPLNEDKQPGLVYCSYGAMFDGVAFTVFWSTDASVPAEGALEYMMSLTGPDGKGGTIKWEEVFGTGLGSRAFRVVGKDNGYMVLSSNKKYFFNSGNALPGDELGKFDKKVEIEVLKVLNGNLGKY